MRCQPQLQLVEHRVRRAIDHDSVGRMVYVEVREYVPDLDPSQAIEDRGSRGGPP